MTRWARTSARWGTGAAAWCGPQSWPPHHHRAWSGSRSEEWSSRCRPVARLNRRRAWGGRFGRETRWHTAKCSPLHGIQKGGGGAVRLHCAVPKGCWGEEAMAVVTDRRPCCGWAGESSSHCWTCAGPSRGYTGTWPSSISPWCRCTSFCQRDSPLQTSAAGKTRRARLLRH